MGVKVRCPLRCFQWLKVTKMKANHNPDKTQPSVAYAVSNGSKLLKWKQITTEGIPAFSKHGCFQWLKVTKMKANHNKLLRTPQKIGAVSNGSKLLKWKQITTKGVSTLYAMCCFQWLKVTKMKANHNAPSAIPRIDVLFPMAQSY